jgi:hypothetical protein
LHPPRTGSHLLLLLLLLGLLRSRPQLLLLWWCEVLRGWHHWQLAAAACWGLHLRPASQQALG